MWEFLTEIRVLVVYDPFYDAIPAPPLSPLLCKRLEHPANVVLADAERCRDIVPRFARRPPCDLDHAFWRRVVVSRFDQVKQQLFHLIEVRLDERNIRRKLKARLDRRS